MPISPQVLALAHMSSKPISRSVDSPKVIRRVMRVTAYTKDDFSMNGLGITASGTKAVEGRTIAADRNIPFGTRIYIPALHMTCIVEDRGSAIKGNKLDLFMESRSEALKFGVKYLEVYIKYQGGN